MQIKKDGIFRTIESKDFGLYQLKGWEKVIEETLPKLEEVEKMEVIDEFAPVIEAGKGVVVEEPIMEVVEEEPIREVEVDVEFEKPKSRKRK